MNLFKLKDITIEEIMEILEDAIEIKNGKKYDLKGKTLVNLFFEPSTRTQYSFESAAYKMNMNVINFQKESSSLLKGESFYDTVKTFDCFNNDVLVIRTNEDHYYNKLSSIKTPIINGGDGSSDHPTQSLLDLMTIKEEYGSFDGLNICIIGDIKHSRVAKSNIDVMKRLKMNVFTAGPNHLLDTDYDIISMEDAIKKMDVIMLLRVQLERHNTDYSVYNTDYLSKYGITLEKVSMMKENAIIMHPAPYNRNIEIQDEVVECSKSRIMKQMENGVYVRCAVLKRSVLNE